MNKIIKDLIKTNQSLIIPAYLLKYLDKLELDQKELILLTYLINQKDLVIKYSDVMKSVISGATKVVDIVSYVLIGFVAISLIVSSIMISIPT